MSFLGQQKTVNSVILPNRDLCISLRSSRLLLRFYCSRVVCCADEFAVKTYNAARYKPSFQSSVWSLGDRHASANLANDGLLGTNLIGHEGFQCSVSNEEPYPWWAVDLGQPKAVYYVILTNIGDCCGTYFTSLDSSNLIGD